LTVDTSARKEGCPKEETNQPSVPAVRSGAADGVIRGEGIPEAEYRVWKPQQDSAVKGWGDIGRIPLRGLPEHRVCGIVHRADERLLLKVFIGEGVGSSWKMG